MLNNRIFLLEMHAVLISCFSGSIRASSVTEVVLLYSVSYGGNITLSDPQLQNDTNEAQKFYLYIFMYRRANVKIRSMDGSMSKGGRRLRLEIHSPAMRTVFVFHCAVLE